MTTKHTPAPWRVARRPASDGAEVRAIASVAWCGTAASFGTKETQVIDADEAYANACLVAAAPDLLAACEALAEWWHTHGIEGTSATDEIAAMARRAVAKAKGEKP